MGTDLYLVWNGECVADLGREHNYHFDSEITRHDLINDIIIKVLSYQGYVPKDLNELENIICQLDNDITETCGIIYEKGQTNILEHLREQGFEIMTDYEYNSRNKSKSELPDYVVPKISGEE